MSSRRSRSRPGICENSRSPPSAPRVDLMRRTGIFLQSKRRGILPAILRLPAPRAMEQGMASSGRAAHCPAASSAKARVGSVTSRNTALTTASARNSSSWSSHDCNSSNPQVPANSLVKTEWKSAASSSLSARFQVSKSGWTATLVLSLLSLSALDAPVTAWAGIPVDSDAGPVVGVGTKVGGSLVSLASGTGFP